MATAHHTHEHDAHLAHHFDDAEQQYVSAELGMWLFLATEVLFFGGLFLAYAIYRFWYPYEFIAASHHLDVTLGAINTTVLLASSLTMALSVHAAQTSNRKNQVRYLTLTLLLGLAFLGIKSFEYYHKFEEGLVPGRNFAMAKVEHDAEKDPLAHPPAGDYAGRPGGPKSSIELFFSLYFMMTGLHAVHMVIGMGVLVVLIVAASRGAFSAEYFTPVEMSGLYWHFVDIVWVFLFPLLYLIR